MTALLTQVHGLSWVTERVYASRVSHVPELARLGVRVGVNGADQYVLGRQRVRGGHALVRDIRCGAALLVAAAAADAPVTLHDPAGHLARGYGDLRAKLAHVGMDLEDVHDPGA
jgi:UDP-N-acetylglucosamine 1-carboxyvinyltransferase